MCQAISNRLAEQEAEAVVLFGSWLRGDAYKNSDLDIHPIGKGPYYTLERHENFLVSISWSTATQDRKAFKDPSKAGGIIPAWRNAEIVYDPKGIARTLKEEAHDWRWEHITKKADKWVAENLTGYAEEVHKLVGNLQLNRASAAAVQRFLLAIYMAPILAVHHRILYDTENRLWDLVSAKMGKQWTNLQNTALGINNPTFQDSCQAALQLFTLTAKQVKHLLSQKQYEVVAYACKIAGYPI